MNHSSQTPPKGYQQLISGHFTYDGDLPAPAVEVLAKMGLSELINNALNRSIEEALKKPSLLKAVQDAASLVYTTQAAQVTKAGAIDIILIPYTIWYR